MPEGYYTVKTGDSPASIAGDVYGDQRMFAEIMKANGGVALKPGMRIVLPRKIETPFVSNELAAAVGLATSGQVADAYKPDSGQLSSYGNMNWTPSQAMGNQEWAQAHARGQAGNLEYGRLPGSFVPQNRVPVKTSSITIPTGADPAFTRWQNTQRGTPTTQTQAANQIPAQVSSTGGMKIMPDQAIGTQKTNTIASRAPGSPNAWSQGIGYAYMRDQANQRANKTTVPLNGYGFGMGAPGSPTGVRGVDWGFNKPGDIEAFKQQMNFSALTPALEAVLGPRVSSANVGTPVTQPTTSASTPTVSQSPENTILTDPNISWSDVFQNVDWMAVRAGLAVPPPYNYPSYGQFSPYQDAGQGASQAQSMNFGLMGNMNTRLASG
jgi:hypothetical protein